MVACDLNPDASLIFKIAETEQELEECFRLLHSSYVSSGFMRPDPSGMRATIFHALPTTTTLCAKFNGKVVGTISLIRESSFGFPMQSSFDLSEIRSLGGNIAEVSALAVHRSFRKHGGVILFPLMKFMYNYSTRYFDTRHLVIAVNPRHIKMYESLLFFRRLDQAMVESYDFANGAKAIGAHLDLEYAPAIFKNAYGHKNSTKNLHAFFVETDLKNIIWPSRRYYTTNDPVMTPELLDHFFNQKTSTFSDMDEDERAAIHAIYDTEKYQKFLPVCGKAILPNSRRRHQRHSIKCPAIYVLQDEDGIDLQYSMDIIEMTPSGFLAYTNAEVPRDVWGFASIQLGTDESSTMKVMMAQGSFKNNRGFYRFKIDKPDQAWIKAANVLRVGSIQADLNNATQFLDNTTPGLITPSNPDAKTSHPYPFAEI